MIAVLYSGLIIKLTVMFTTPAFTRSGSEKLCKQLKEMGYVGCAIRPGIPMTYLATSPISFGGAFTNITEHQFDSTDPYVTYNTAGRVDCGESIELFLAIASLRNDHDKDQWFTNADESVWEKSSEYVYEKEGFHKATIMELRKHFYYLNPNRDGNK